MVREGEETGEIKRREKKRERERMVKGQKSGKGG